MGIIEWKAERQRLANTDFCKLITDHAKEWCDLHNKECSVENIISFLVRHNIIKQPIINRYLVINKYPEILDDEGGKEKAVFALSNKLPLEPKAIYHIIKNHSGYFRPCKNR